MNLLTIEVVDNNNFFQKLVIGYFLVELDLAGRVEVWGLLPSSTEPQGTACVENTSGAFGGSQHKCKRIFIGYVKGRLVNSRIVVYLLF